MYTPSAIDSTTTRPVSVARRPSTGSLTDSECSSSSLETPISYATDPDHPEAEAPRTTRQLKDRRPPSTFVSRRHLARSQRLLSLTSLFSAKQYLKKKSEMSWAEYLCDLATCDAELHVLKDESIDRGPVADVPVWKEHAFILSRALVPLVVQQLAYWALPSTSLPHSRCFRSQLTLSFPQTSNGLSRSPIHSTGYHSLRSLYRSSSTLTVSLTFFRARFLRSRRAHRFFP